MDVWGGSLVGYSDSRRREESEVPKFHLANDSSALGERAQLDLHLPLSQLVKKEPKFLASKPDRSFLDNYKSSSPHVTHPVTRG